MRRTSNWTGIRPRWRGIRTLLPNPRLRLTVPRRRRPRRRTLSASSISVLFSTIIGKLDEDGYLTATLEEMGHQGGTTREVMEAALKAVQGLDPAGVGARD